MKINYKKITSVLTSALLIGSTSGFALAANFPSPFVVGGTSDVGVIYGANAAITDLAAAVDIGDQLSGTSSGGSEGSVTGEAYPLFAGGNSKPYLNDSLNKIRETVTDTDLPTVLAEGDFSGNVNADYTQTIKVGSYPITKFTKEPTSNDDPALLIKLGTSRTQYLYNLTVDFSKNICFNCTDSEGEDLTLFGQKFTIGTDTDATNLVMYKSSETVTLSIGGDYPSSQTVTVEGEEYTLELISSSDTAATIKVTDSTGASASKEITEDTSKKVQGLEISVNSADESDFGLIAELTIGASKLTFTRTSEVKEGTDETPIEGTYVEFDSASVGNVTKMTIQVYAPDGENDAIIEGESFIDPVFGTLKVDFSGLNVASDDIAARGEFIIKNSGNDKMQVTFTDHAGDTGTVTFMNNESAAKLADGSAWEIEVMEMAAINESAYAVVGNEDEGYLVKLTTILNSTGTAANRYSDDKVVFTNALNSAQTWEAKITSEGSGSINIGGKDYTVTYLDTKAGDNSATARLNYPDSDDDGYLIVYPTIETSKGALIAFYEPLNYSLYDSTNSYHNVTRLMFPDGNGYTTLYVNTTMTGGRGGAAGTCCNYSIGTSAANADAGTENLSYTTAPSIDLAIGQLSYNFTWQALNTTLIRLEQVDGTAAIDNPALVIFEEENDNDVYEALIVKLDVGGTSDDGVGVDDIETTWGVDGEWDEKQLESDDDLYQSMELWGVLITTDRSESDQYTATITYPDEQVYPQIYVAEVGASIDPSSVGGGGSSTFVVPVKDSEVNNVKSKNLVIVGGSCINSVAANLLGGSLCTSAFTAETGIGAGEWLIQSFESPYATGKVALLVAGYNAADTVNAATLLVNEGSSEIDTAAGKKYKGSTSTSVTEVVE